MSDARQQTPKYYREKAHEIRRFALRARSANVRVQLFDIAELFDRMAARAKGGINPCEGLEDDLKCPTIRMPPQLRPPPIEIGGHP
jgi:hypothetical protein